MEKFLIVGGGGRESAFAMKCAAETAVYAVADHPNPTVTECVRRTGGVSLIANAADPAIVARFAREQQIDYAFVNSDAPLANGVTDALLAENIKTIGGTKAACRIEWDKIYSIQLAQKISPAHVPFYRIAENENALDDILREFESQNIAAVVKPQGLTGGKGVKVMPQHLADYGECRDYAARLLSENPGESVLLTEKLDGAEFTIMGLTDGKTLAMAPATFDYPYRFANDTGPGTGGMGCITAAGKLLPFMDERDWRECESFMQRAIDEMRANGMHFTGVLNGGFFKTEKGIRFMEFNARFGDPEALNILMLLQESFPDLLRAMHSGTLHDVRFAARATVVKYLVSRDYPLPGGGVVAFHADESAIAADGVEMFCASCVADENRRTAYKTLGKPSRVVALGCAADDIPAAAARIDAAIDRHIVGDLDFRRDIGSQDDLHKLRKLQTANLREENF